MSLFLFRLLLYYLLTSFREISIVTSIPINSNFLKLYDTRMHENTPIVVFIFLMIVMIIVIELLL